MKTYVSVPPAAKPWVKVLQSAEKAVEAMRSLVKRNEVLLDRNKRLREEIRRLTRGPRAQARSNSSV